jgi:hypothetical protein
MFVVSACEAAQPVGIGSLESISGLIKSLKIRALKYGKGSSTLVQSKFESWSKLILANIYLKHNAAVTSLPSPATSAIAVLPVILANYTHKDDRLT